MITNLDTALESLDKSIDNLFPNHILSNESLISLEGLFSNLSRNQKNQISNKQTSTLKTPSDNKWYMDDVTIYNIKNMDAYFREFQDKCYEELRNFGEIYLDKVSLGLGLPLVITFSTVTDHNDLMNDNGARLALNNTFSPSATANVLYITTIFRNRQIIDTNLPFDKEFERKLSSDPTNQKMIKELNKAAIETSDKLSKYFMKMIALMNSVNTNAPNIKNNMLRQINNNVGGITMCVMPQYDPSTKMISFRYHEIDILRNFTFSQLISKELFYLTNECIKEVFSDSKNKEMVDRYCDIFFN